MINTSLDSFNFYFLFAVFQGIVLSVLIVAQRPFRKPNLFLALLILLFSISLLHLVLEQSIHAFNVKFPVPMDFSLAYGPLAYWHVITIKDPKRKFRLSDLLHFLPSLLLDGVLFVVFFLYAGANIDWAYNNVETIQQWALIITLLSLAQLIGYTFFTYREAREARIALKEFNAIRKWLGYILSSWMVIIVFLIIAVPIALFNVKQIDEKSFLLYQPLGVIIGLCIYALGYLYLLRFIKKVNAYIERVERFRFSDDELLERKELLLEVFQTKQLYKDPDISLSKLAAQLGWPINDLSLTINETFQTNFNDWVNQHRVRAFIAALRDPANKKYSIVGLSQEVGFSSKASFYRAFKKETGMTPSDYIESEQVPVEKASK